jgi:hypothetical protein
MDARPLTDKQLLPAPPRDVRRAAAFARRAPLGVLGGLLLAGAAAASAFVLAAGSGLPFEDHALDAQPATTAGTILARDQVTSAAGAALRLRYRYRVRGQEHEQVSYARPADAPAGPSHPVEFLAREPAVSRLRGTTRAVPPAVPWRVLVGGGGLGFMLLLLWLRTGVAERQLLREGAVVPGQVHSARPVAGIRPPQLAVEFSFRDGQRNPHTVRQWYAAGSPPGRALLAGVRDLPVVHDPARPERCTLATTASFEAAHGG